jgi:hypothetical protein
MKDPFACSTYFSLLSGQPVRVADPPGHCSPSHCWRCAGHRAEIELLQMQLQAARNEIWQLQSDLVRTSAPVVYSSRWVL